MRWPLPSPAHRDYRALALGKIPDWGWDLKDFKSPCLYQVADTFNYHLVRTSTFALMPAWIALESIREQLWLDYLAVKDGRQLNPDLMAYVSSPAGSPDTQKGFYELAMGYREISKESLRQLLSEIGVEYIETRTQNSSAIAMGVDVVFDSVIREAWTAFEDLSRELWIATLDNDNGVIATRATQIPLRKPSKEIVATYNFKTHLGSFQVETRQVVFQRLETIRKNYATVFGRSVEALFDKAEAGYIHVLWAFRNILVHKRGKADQKFVDQVSGFREFGHIRVGDILCPTGTEVRQMRDAAMIVGRKLIQLADTELQKQKS